MATTLTHVLGHESFAVRVYSGNMLTTTRHAQCRQCGATSYARLTHRAADGAMVYSGQYRCSGCSLIFSDLADSRAPAAADPNPSGRADGAGRGEVAAH